MGNLSARTWLVTLGAWNEVLGLLLVASPELLPRLQLLGIYLLGFIRTFRRRLTIVLTRLLRVPRQPRHISVGVGSSLATAFGINARASVRPGGDVEARIEWLIRELDKHDVRLIGLEEEVAKLPERWKGDLAELRAELEDLQRDLVQRAANARIRLRLLGLGYVVLGLILAWLGNLA